MKDLTTRLEEGLANSVKNAKREAIKLHAKVGSFTPEQDTKCKFIAMFRSMSWRENLILRTKLGLMLKRTTKSKPVTPVPNLMN